MEQEFYNIAKEEGIYKTFEEIFVEFSEKEKKEQLRRYKLRWEKEKIIGIIKEERDYWKNRFEKLQNKLEDPLDEVFECTLTPKILK